MKTTGQVTDSHKPTNTTINAQSPIYQKKTNQQIKQAKSIQATDQSNQHAIKPSNKQTTIQLLNRKRIKRNIIHGIN